MILDNKGINGEKCQAVNFMTSGLEAMLTAFCDKQKLDVRGPKSSVLRNRASEIGRKCKYYFDSKEPDSFITDSAVAFLKVVWWKKSNYLNHTNLIQFLCCLFTFCCCQLA